jgi:DeoR family glycerol-3-phosphate regulon repressor
LQGHPHEYAGVRRAQITSAIIENSQTRFLVADVSKWTRNASVRVAPFDKMTRFYTDRLPDDPSIAEAISAFHIEVVLCGEELS